MLNIGPQELILVLIIALVVVGPQRLPELGRAVGKALREFRKIQDDVKDSIKFDMDLDAEPMVTPKTTRHPSEPTGSTEPDESVDDDVPDPGTAITTTATPEIDLGGTEGDAEPRAAG